MLEKVHLINYIKENLRKDHMVSDDLRDAAVQLYSMLRNKPPITSSNRIIGILDDNGKEKYSNLTEYYNDKQRIEFLLFWTVKMIPILDILTGIGKLPYYRKKNETDFEEFVNRKLEVYKEAINALEDRTILSNEDINFVGTICDDLNAALSRYLEGFPGEAFIIFKRIMECIEALNIDSLTDSVGKVDLLLFKMRLGSSNRMFGKDEMFHIPFENRGLVKTNRYSIPGLPCLYLGRTPLTCWEEMGKPDLNTTHTSLFIPAETLSYFDISIPPAAIADHLVKYLKYRYGEDLSNLYRLLRTYLIMWPLIASCSIRVLNTEDTFKPEYILSQLLLQWIQQSAKYDGISYFSTKINHYSEKNYWVYQNFAFPVKERKGTGYCEQLRSKFLHITNASPWQVFQLHKELTGIGEQNTMIEFMSGMSVNYNKTDFGRLETFLTNVLTAESMKF
ncbi:RES domain-containing protein [Paenibacillus polymyxa]|uniref:RES domain-containing protein n=1 Tax=Paenibacillus polymyxa TaxID=1406 RepID=UPI0032174BEF